MPTDANATLDARGLNCPLPVIKTKKELNKLAKGEILLVIASDPGSEKDIPSFCLQTRNKLISSTVCENEFRFMIEKTA